MRAARRSFRIVFGKPGPTLNLRDESPVGENRKWNAGRRVRPQAEGGASRLTPWRVPHAACVRASNPCVCRRSALLIFCRFFLRHCRARPGNPCGRKARSDLPIRLSEPQFSMDHRVKPGGDEEFCKTRARKTAPRERGCFPAPRSTATSTPARPCSASSPSPTSWGRIRTAAACCSAAMNSVYPARYDATERRRVQPSKIGAQGG
jgi:hypothetical protein